MGTCDFVGTIHKMLKKNTKSDKEEQDITSLTKAIAACTEEIEHG
ncbi:hypothetical protein RDI58_007587 [Solanum bulbocastanum]|uniref:Uncharacterized protein n=1 Tax=Solanum bulbocastanum TaxID=147425 RepID=A0AAN8TWN0_SOLBU